MECFILQSLFQVRSGKLYVIIYMLTVGSLIRKLGLTKKAFPLKFKYGNDENIFLTVHIRLHILHTPLVEYKEFSILNFSISTTNFHMDNVMLMLFTTNIRKQIVLNGFSNNSSLHKNGI